MMQKNTVKMQQLANERIIQRIVIHCNEMKYYCMDPIDVAMFQTLTTRCLHWPITITLQHQSIA